MSLVRNPFSCSVDSIPDKLQDELIDLQNNSTAKDLVDDSTVKEFWTYMIGLYPNVAKVALHLLLPFVLIFLCESGISTMLLIKLLTETTLNWKMIKDVLC